MFWKSVKKEIAKICDELLKLIVLQEVNNDSTGVTNAVQIITEYLDHNELGLAFEHLEYVIEELKLHLNLEQQQKMISISNKISK